MLKRDYKAHVEVDRFDLNILPACGAKTRSGGLCRHKGNIRMVDVNGTGGASIGPTNQTFGKSHHRYVHGLRTKEVIAMRKLATEINKSY